MFQILIYFLCEKCNTPWKKSLLSFPENPSKRLDPVNPPPSFLKFESRFKPPTPTLPSAEEWEKVHTIWQWFSIHWEILIMLLSQFPLTFHQIHNGMPFFIAYLMTILVLIDMVFVIIWKMFHGSLGEVGVSAAASELYEWVRDFGKFGNWCIYSSYKISGQACSVAIT